MFLFQKHPPFLKHILTSILTPPLSNTSPKISEIPLHHTRGIFSQPLTCIPISEELSKDSDGNVWKLFVRVRCWDTFLVLWNLPKAITTCIMESIYTLSTRALCFRFESTNNYSEYLSRKQKFKHLSVSLARRHQKMECCNFINNQLTMVSHVLFATEKKNSAINWWKIITLTISR